jgi:murein DD-endopeptidase MepM/ murein hydrolase activator NlpD
MARRLLLGLVVALVVAAPAAGDDHPSKVVIDARIAAVNAKIARAHAEEGILSSQISQVTGRIRALQGEVDSASARLSVLEQSLALHRDRLGKLNTLYKLETRRLVFLKRQYALAVERLNKRLVDIYETDPLDTVGVVLSARSFTELLDQLDYLNQIGGQDQRIALDVGTAKDAMRRTRAKTKRIRTAVQVETNAVAQRTAEQRAIQDRLLASQSSLGSARTEKQRRLSSVRESKSELLHEMEGLQHASAALGATIQAAQASGATDTSPSAAGFIWPVSGPVTSGFGMRWGRMHEGIDIGAASGTPIHAAAAGSVIYAGWMSGYGNLVVIDHHNTLATAYAHQSALGTSVGAAVAQGQVIGYVGCTGHCFGPHLHFEVRVNGVPVDPLRYL